MRCPACRVALLQATDDWWVCPECKNEWAPSIFEDEREN